MVRQALLDAVVVVGRVDADRWARHAMDGSRPQQASVPIRVRITRHMTPASIDT